MEKKDVRLILDSDGYVIGAGDPDISDKEWDSEMLSAIKSGGSVKTIPFSEYKNQKWIHEKPKATTINQP